MTVKEGLEPAALPVGAGEAAREAASRSTRAPVERPASKLEKLRLVVPEGSRKQAEVLGEGPEAAPRVVEVMQQLGVA